MRPRNGDGRAGWATRSGLRSSVSTPRRPDVEAIHSSPSSWGDRGAHPPPRSGRRTRQCPAGVGVSRPLRVATALAVRAAAAATAAAVPRSGRCRHRRRAPTPVHPGPRRGGARVRSGRRSVPPMHARPQRPVCPRLAAAIWWRGGGRGEYSTGGGTRRQRAPHPPGGARPPVPRRPVWGERHATHTGPRWRWQCAAAAASRRVTALEAERGRAPTQIPHSCALRLAAGWRPSLQLSGRQSRDGVRHLSGGTQRRGLVHGTQSPQPNLSAGRGCASIEAALRP